MVREGKIRRASTRGKHSRELRIIAGAWRGRRLRFPADADIRPTPDRVRETLFNWLGTHVRGARCLDLFAGSGALGLEALSRGAAEVVFVEKDASAAAALRTHLTEFGGQSDTRGRIERMDALQFLRRDATPFDIVFLDPPFVSDLLVRAAALLEERGWLGAGALIYVECAAREGLPQLPQNWALLKARQAGEVGYHLFRRDAP